VSETYFQKGFGLKAAVGPVLSQNYASAVVDRLRALGHAARAGDVTLKLAREFGFCYGVDRAVEYAYETGSSSRTGGSSSPARSSTTRT
jgi:4-hydroxy-3-methylbut-2-enyl diphosphate reductase